MEAIFHIVERNIWDNAKLKSEYEPISVRKEGFIHCSTKSQVISVANRFYRRRDGLVLLRIDPGLVKNEIRYEEASDGVEGKFPHIYGSLNVEAVTDVVDFSCEQDGSLCLPSELKD